MAVYVGRGVPEDCPLLPRLRDHVDGLCDDCGAPLTGRQTRWCSKRCSTRAYMEFLEQHEWSSAREAALERDGRRCTRCGEPARTMLLGRSVRVPISRSNLEVDHIDPRAGRGYGRGCHHHLSNLRTLCRACHVARTNEHRRSSSGFTTSNEVAKQVAR